MSEARGCSIYVLSKYDALQQQSLFVESRSRREDVLKSPERRMEEMGNKKGKSQSPMRSPTRRSYVTLPGSDNVDRWKATCKRVAQLFDDQQVWLQ